MIYITCFGGPEVFIHDSSETVFSGILMRLCFNDIIEIMFYLEYTIY